MRTATKCFQCNDGHTPLYCLNCAREGWVKWHDFRDSIVHNIRSGMSYKKSIDATLRQFMPKFKPEHAAGEIAKWAACHH